MIMDEVTKITIVVPSFNNVRKLTPNKMPIDRKYVGKLKQDQANEFLAYYNQIHWTLRPDEPWQKAHLKLTFIAKKKRGSGWDLDNLVAGVKASIDAAKELIIVDDAADKLTIEPYYELDPVEGEKIIYEYTKVE